MTNKQVPSQPEKNEVFASDDDEEWDDIFAAQEAREDECAKAIVACFNDVAGALDVYRAWDLFSAFVRVAKPMRRQRRRSREEADNDALLASYDAAPKGQKGAVLDAFAAKHGVDRDSVLRRVRRLRRVRKTIEEWFRQKRVTDTP